MRQILLVSCLFLSGYSPAFGQKAEFQNVTIRPGDTLWGIANFYLKDPTSWNEILKYNSLPTSDPSVALPGMVLRVPVYLIKETLRAARLVYFLNEVLYRKRETPDWKSVSLNMDLYQDDGLRTTSDAQARVKFYSGEILSLYSNSIAVLRPPYKRTDVELLKGEVRGVRSRVLTASARITPKTADTDFSAKVKEDLTTLVQVYKGKADVEAQGKTVEVGAGFASEIPLDMPPSDPIKLPPLPEFQKQGVASGGGQAGPQVQFNGTVMSLRGVRTGESSLEGPEAGRSGVAAGTFSAGAPGIGTIKSGENIKTLSVGNPIQGYHVQIARDTNFSAVVMDRHYSAFENIDLKEILPEGKYWVRISLVDLLGLEGRFTAPRQVMVAAAPPVLEIYSPKPGEKVYDQVLVVEGRTDKDCEVSVGGRAAIVDADGGFSVTMRLKEGANDINVVSTGRKGLVSTARRRVSYSRTREPQFAQMEKQTNLFEEFKALAGGGFGLTLLVSGLIIVAVVLLFLV